MELTRGQVAVVTGGGSGIGLALAERFARAGLDVVLADVEDGRPRRGRRPGRRRTASRCTPFARTSARRPRCRRSPREAVDRFGGVHVVCNNAGVAPRGDAWFGPLSAWEWVMGVNFWGVVHGCRAFLPHLLGGGHIVNTASMAGLMPGFAPSYDASKHAVVAISEDLYQRGHRRRAADRGQRAVPRLGAHAHPRRRPQLAGRPRRAAARLHPSRASCAPTSPAPSTRAAPRRRWPTPWPTP